MVRPTWESWCEVTFPDAGWPGQQHVAPLPHEAARRQVVDLLFLDRANAGHTLGWLQLQ